MERKTFYNVVRQGIGALTQENVDGMERYLNEGWKRSTALDRLAYIMATVYWETGRTMQPVEEAFYLGSKAEAFRKKLRYFPWHGRGDIQLTWEDNYKRAGAAIGVDLIANPDAAMIPENAVRIAFEGMEEGWFTGKAVGDYLDGVDEGDKEDLREFANARRVVNGTDKQIEIGKLALTFEKALRDSGYDAKSTTAPVVVPAPTPRPEPEPEDDHPDVPDGVAVPKPASGKFDPRKINKALQAAAGAITMYFVGKGVIPQDAAGPFATQLVELAFGVIGTVTGPAIGPANRV